MNCTHNARARTFSPSIGWNIINRTFIFVFFCSFFLSATSSSLVPFVVSRFSYFLARPVHPPPRLESSRQHSDAGSLKDVLDCSAQSIPPHSFCRVLFVYRLSTMLTELQLFGIRLIYYDGVFSLHCDTVPKIVNSTYKQLRHWNSISKANFGKIIYLKINQQKTVFQIFDYLIYTFLPLGICI